MRLLDGPKYTPAPERKRTIHASKRASSDGTQRDPRLNAVGVEWVVDAAGCDPAALCDATTLEALFAAILDAARLTPVAAPTWHRFPHTGGLTGVQVLAESHLACHTFPEHASFCLNVFCCVARPEWDVEGVIGRFVGAREINVRRIERHFVAPAVSSATGSSTES
jgi:S-adenosylmethionine decarboxylase